MKKIRKNVLHSDRQYVVIAHDPEEPGFIFWAGRALDLSLAKKLAVEKYNEIFVSLDDPDLDEETRKDLEDSQATLADVRPELESDSRVKVWTVHDAVKIIKTNKVLVG